MKRGQNHYERVNFRSSQVPAQDKVAHGRVFERPRREWPAYFLRKNLCSSRTYEGNKQAFVIGRVCKTLQTKHYTKDLEEERRLASKIIQSLTEKNQKKRRVLPKQPPRR